jgi:hypothetical protein
MFTNPYATDGKCHNANPDTYGHECGQPARWIGVSAEGFASGFCQRCKEEGYEARSITRWIAKEGGTLRDYLQAL